MITPVLIALAWGMEVALGWPNWLYRRIAHPVVWIGGMINAFEARLNCNAHPPAIQYVFGAFTAIITITAATGVAIVISHALPNSWWGTALEALIASSLLASRSLYEHILNVLRPLHQNDLETAREAVSRIVGRDPNQLDENAIARASLESLAENTSDGVTAPIFWGLIFGLPGLVAYKSVNTLDSMIGHRTPKFARFGGFAARLDDLANLIPARMTGLLFAMASANASAFKVLLRDSGKHRSPNAGWPEAAMAGGLNVRLSGPRTYAGHSTNEPWLNAGARDPEAQDIKRGLALYVRAMSVLGGLLILGIVGAHHAK
ncbi:MAG: cobalamin biosynthesis protein CobD [Henriciella sp.]|nr:cobalamin biosynthesis protein CobD [Henriciella sp.]